MELADLDGANVHLRCHGELPVSGVEDFGDDAGNVNGDGFTISLWAPPGTPHTSTAPSFVLFGPQVTGDGTDGTGWNQRLRSEWVATGEESGCRFPRRRHAPTDHFPPFGAPDTYPGGLPRRGNFCRPKGCPDVATTSSSLPTSMAKRLLSTVVTSSTTGFASSTAQATSMRTGSMILRLAPSALTHRKIYGGNLRHLVARSTAMPMAFPIVATTA
jgi:hypothetical protein